MRRLMMLMWSEWMVWRMFSNNKRACENTCAGYKQLGMDACQGCARS